MRLRIAGVAVTGLLAAVWAAGDTPSQAKLTGYPANPSATPVARAMARDKKLVRRAVFSAVPPSVRPTAVSTTRMAGFPTHGKTFAVMSTGRALDADNPNDSTSTGSSSGGPAIRGARDVTIMRIDLRVPSGDNCLSFDFRFLSEEYPETIGDIYNDAFIAELGVSNWNADGTTDPTIESPRNFARDTSSSPIRINKTGFTGMTSQRARGTTFDGATRKLRASTRILPGLRKLYLSIFDQGDRVYDSAVFVDNLRTSPALSCRTGVRSSN